jgi:hypothetical protein
MRRATVLHVIDFHVFRLFKSLSRVGFALLVSFALIGLVLGIVGYHQVGAQQNPPSSTADEFYQLLQLFVLGAPSPDGEIPPTLDLARYLAAIVSFSAAISRPGKVYLSSRSCIDRLSLDSSDRRQPTGIRPTQDDTGIYYIKFLLNKSFHKFMPRGGGPGLTRSALIFRLLSRFKIHIIELLEASIDPV